MSSAITECELAPAASVLREPSPLVVADESSVEMLRRDGTSCEVPAVAVPHLVAVGWQVRRGGRHETAGVEARTPDEVAQLGRDRLELAALALKARRRRSATTPPATRVKARSSRRRARERRAARRRVAAAGRSSPGDPSEPPGSRPRLPRPPKFLGSPGRIAWGGWGT